MSGATRYILRELLGPLVFVTATLAGVVWLTQGLRLVNLIINQGLSATGFLTMMMLLLPGFLALVLPTALFLSIVFVYHRLNSDSELVIMRAVGLSPYSLAAPAIILALLVSSVGYAITLYFMPAGFRSFKDQQFTVRSDYAAALLKEGTFNTLMDGVTVYVRERTRKGELRGLLVHDNRNADEPITMMAERGALVGTANGPRFIMFKGNRQEIDAGRDGVRLLYFDKYALDLGRFASPNRSRWREPGERFLGELLRPGHSEDDIANAHKFKAEAHRRLVTPLYALAFAIIGLASILPGEYNRRVAWRRTLFAAVTAITVQVIGLSLVPLVAKHPELAGLMYANVALPIAITLYILFAPPQSWHAAVKWSRARIR